VSLPSTQPIAPNRGMILISIMLATIMTALDSTIAIVALPHMAGSVSASADEITWVLTSYIIASAIMTPMSGWLAGRLGRKQVFIISIAGFTLTSALCGAAQTLDQIVLFRVLQGLFGASMMPLSQAVVMDIYTPEERGPVMGLWGMGVMVAPILGPVLGGWLTDDFSWRWVFFINLPVGVACLLGVMTFVHEQKEDRKIPFDVTGFALLSIGLASLQLFLDRGQNNGWFESTETLLEASVCGMAFLLFAIHTVSFPRPFLPVELLGDRNFVTATVLGFATGILVFSVLALLPPMTETLMGYPVITTGLVTAPRGVGSLITMFFAGRLVGRIDTRFIITTGLVLVAASFWGMSRFSLQMGSAAIAATGFVQGLGTGLVFMPVTTLAFVSLAPALRADGAGVFTLMRNLGNSVGVSIMQAQFVRSTDVVRTHLVEPLRRDNPMVQPPYLPAPFSLSTPGGLAALDGEVTRQASMVAYVGLFHMMFVATLVMVPLVLLLRRSGGPAPAESQALEH
jgi:DHA2 family multidrug resistance protein